MTTKEKKEFNSNLDKLSQEEQQFMYDLADVRLSLGRLSHSDLTQELKQDKISESVAEIRRSLMTFFLKNK